ncbi:calmodulin-like [Aethina tumida]|uniref:calmodulin-like n=1 Tax=Aethina tumida TaxID=116153 RepID=UPI00214933EC|nr:calmodulin-like [Aethina tumida]
MEHFTTDQMIHMKTAFDAFDADRSNFITIASLPKVMASLNVYLSVQDIREIREQFKVHYWIDFHTFLRIVEEKIQNTERKLLYAFRVFDRERTGYIAADRLRAIMQNYGDKMSYDDVTEMLMFADVERTGRINYEDFATLIAEYI